MDIFILNLSLLVFSESEQPPRTRPRWSPAKHDIFIVYFQQQLQNSKLPSSKEFIEFQQKYPQFKRQTIAQLKSKAQNALNKFKKSV